MTNLKIKIFMSLSALILVSCGGSGGSSNVSVKNDISANISKNNDILNDEKIQRLKEKVLKEDYKENLKKEKEKKGETQKVALSDIYFDLKDGKYNDRVELIEGGKLRGEGNDHGRKVLDVIMEDTKLRTLALQTGGEGKILTFPTKEGYEKVFEKFGEQKIKVLNQSWGADEVNKYTNETLPENLKDLRDLFRDKVNNHGAIFVWSNGNHNIEGREVYNASVQAALPKFEGSLQKGWISVIGIKTYDKDSNKYNTHPQNSTRLAFPGDAKWWSISANENNVDGTKRGSSFAAPRVSRAAALVAEKFPFMSNAQVKETLFTTTDRTEVSKKEERNTVPEPSDKYGWGMLNTQRALKGPGAFWNELLKRDEAPLTINNERAFEVNINNNETYYFENDIYGDGALIKKGQGTLHLTGNNKYDGETYIVEGDLHIHQKQHGGVKVGEEGKLTLHSNSKIGYNKYFGQYANTPEFEKKNVENAGTVKVIGKGAEIGGDYIAYTGSTTEVNFNSKVKVHGHFINKDGKLKVLKDSYTGKAEQMEIIEAENIEGKFAKVEINGMQKASQKLEDGKIILTVERQNPEKYLQSGEQNSKDVAKNIEKVFEDLDEKKEKGIATEEELKLAYAIQQLSVNNFEEASKKMSGEIYASAQALTFSQAQAINRDLSNRISGIDNLNNSNKDWQVWTSGIAGKGKLYKKGYAGAKTNFYGGQVGLDKKINSNTNLGFVFSYSYSNANFEKYAGNSKSNMVGISAYFKEELKNNFYLASKIGLSTINSKVNRELIDNNAKTVKGEIKHHDKMLSSYLELGKKINHFTPFVAYSNDYLRRGSFVEANNTWGISAKKKDYFSEKIILGIKSEFKFNSVKINSYINHSINIGNRDLSFEGNFVGTKVKQKFKGIEEVKNISWLGLGIFKEINESFGVYGNVDLKFEEFKKASSLFTTGLQYKF